MFERLPVLFRSAMYALRGGFLVRPLLIAVILGDRGRSALFAGGVDGRKSARGFRACCSRRARILAWRR